MATKTMTYKDFAAKITDLLEAIADGDTPDLSKAELDTLIEKANALYTREATKAEAAKTRTSKKNANKPANPLVGQIMGVLTDAYMTGAEIAIAVGDVSITALQISNALRNALNNGTVLSEKVERQTVGADGKATKRKYTAYKLA